MYDADFFSGLVPELRILASRHLENCRAHGLELVFICGRRTWQEQIANFEKGRERTPRGWMLVDAAAVVTLALPDKSAHCRGAGYDCAPLDEHGKIDWLRLDLFRAVADLMPAGLVWGGTFPIHDLDHYELAQWRDLPLPSAE